MLICKHFQELKEDFEVRFLRTKNLLSQGSCLYVLKDQWIEFQTNEFHRIDWWCLLILNQKYLAFYTVLVGIFEMFEAKFMLRLQDES